MGHILESFIASNILTISFLIFLLLNDSYTELGPDRLIIESGAILFINSLAMFLSFKSALINFIFFESIFLLI